MVLYKYIKPLGSSQTFKYKLLGTQASVGARTGLEEHIFTFGATLSKWLAKKLGHFTELDFTQKQLDWILDAFCSTIFYLIKLVFTLHLGFGKVLTEKANFVKFSNVKEWTLEQNRGKEQCYNYCSNC